MKFIFSKIGTEIWFGGAALIVFVFCFACQNVQTKNYNLQTAEPKKSDDVRKWIPGSHFGIRIGVSTRDDLILKFGKPIWEGEEQLEGEPEDVQKALERHSGKRILLEYKDVGGVIGKTSVFIGEKDKIVQAIEVYPTALLTKEEIISKYGDDFVEKYASESVCSTIEKPRREISPETNDKPQVSTQNNLNSIEMLVFPKLGMAASIEKEEKIDQLSFSLKCSN